MTQIVPLASPPHVVSSIQEVHPQMEADVCFLFPVPAQTASRINHSAITCHSSRTTLQVLRDGPLRQPGGAADVRLREARA